jgi:hypothetical protein
MHNEQLEVVRLPLWKNCLEDMLQQGVDHGKTYEADFFENHLKSERTTMAFSLGVSQIRTALLEHGFFLSGRGQKGDQFVILDAASNTRVMENFQHQAAVALKKGVILGTNTRLDVLTDEERRRHEATLERLAIRSALMSRRIGPIKAVLTQIKQLQAA